MNQPSGEPFDPLPELFLELGFDPQGSNPWDFTVQIERRMAAGAPKRRYVGSFFLQELGEDPREFVPKLFGGGVFQLRVRDGARWVKGGTLTLEFPGPTLPLEELKRRVERIHAGERVRDARLHGSPSPRAGTTVSQPPPARRSASSGPAPDRMIESYLRALPPWPTVWMSQQERAWVLEQRRQLLEQLRQILTARGTDPSVLAALEGHILVHRRELESLGAVQLYQVMAETVTQIVATATMRPN
ncbi:MAG: hypothetical protein ACYTGV_19475 [Planctomycetota bacterium]|jgi:hypothetical protein